MNIDALIGLVTVLGGEGELANHLGRGLRGYGDEVHHRLNEPVKHVDWLKASLVIVTRVRSVMAVIRVLTLCR